MFKVGRLSASAVAVTLAGSMIVGVRVAADQTGDTPVYSEALANLNLTLAQSGAKHFQISTAEISVSKAGVDKATTLIANNRTHQLNSQFVARDPRRGGFADLSYLVDQSDGTALGFNAAGDAVIQLPNAVTEPAIDRSIRRWGNATQCPSPALTKVADDGTDPDLIDGLVFNDPTRIGTPRADITQAGWLTAPFFDALTPQGSRFILGVTFTFIFTDDAGNPTDIDGDGAADVAFREIYYNRAFPWTASTPARPFEIDIDSVSTHESGHALGLGHFGKVFLDNNGALKFAPRAVMNAVYASTFFEPAGTDNASYCAVWASRR
jgi:hypothetical protein